MNKVPQYLSSPLQVLWFEIDEVVVIIIAFTNMMLFSGLWSWGCLVLIPYAYIQAKKRYQRGFLKHVMYILGLKDMKGFPGPFDNDFHE